MGIFFGQSVSRQEMEIDIPAFMQAVEDILNNAEKKLTDDEMKKVLNAYQKKEKKEEITKSTNSKVDGEKFLAENKNNDGVIVLASGLQYKIIKNSSAKKPTANSRVVVHYRGTLIDGTEFDSSYVRGEPIELNLNQVIKGWQEALQLMAIGSKWQIVIPSELAYGEKGAGRVIGPNATLIFDIELLSIK
jgi:FKBP-type peptidyl-prolyl cis-trans isomerase FklB